eukprot:7394782-Karenia_brevis.AAC.1
MINGEREDKVEEWEEEFLGRLKPRSFEFAIKQCSKDMANPRIVSCRALKKVARYLVGVEMVVWKY